MVIFGVLSSNSFDITAMQMYIDPASVVITFGGSICSTIGCFKLADGINGFFEEMGEVRNNTRPSGQLLTCQMSEEKKVCLHLKKLQTELKTNS